MRQPEARLLSMYIGEYHISIKQIILMVVLLLSLVTGIFLVLRPQIFRSRAAQNFINAFEVKDAKGNIINCDGNQNPPVCTTSTLDVSIKLKDLNVLTK